MRTLFDQAPHNGTDTSVSAAKAATPAMTARRATVLRAIIQHGPATQEQIADRLAWPIQSVNPRVNELARMNLIRDTGERRPTRSGKRAAVWEVTP
jgi:DNA-binding MarR family transcriptional regulator